MATILIAGGTGLIGNRLTSYLADSGHRFHILTRRPRPQTTTISYFGWDPANKEIDLACFEDVSIIINLAGAGIADKRWTTARKQEILASRLDSIATLKAGMIQAGKRTQLYIGASAIGYYGERGPDIMTEADDAGVGFLAEVTSTWEERQRDLMDLTDRPMLLRIGIVLSTKGGALKEMLKPARFGQYGYFGNGSAYYSCIHIDDICHIIDKAITDQAYTGVYNATSPTPVTIKQLAISLKTAKNGIGLILPVPEFALKLALGEMATMLTTSMRVIPKRLLEQGHTFLYPELIPALHNVLENKV